MSKVAVLGATGGIGNAVIQELANRGHEVTAVSRRADARAPTGVKTLAADLGDQAQAVVACAGAEVAVMAAQVPYHQWADQLGPMIQNVLEGAAQAGARLVMVDNLYAYGSPGTPISESTPEAATTRKGAIRRDIGQRLLLAHREGVAPVTIGRFNDYYGPGGTNSLLYILGIEPALRGKAPRALINPDQSHTFNYLPDTAWAFATLVERPESEGRVWILPAPPPITQRELMTLVTDAVGLPPRVGRVTPLMLTLAGLFKPQIRELRELAEQWGRPYTTDASAFQSAFGSPELTPHQKAVPDTVAWFRERRTTGR